MRQNLPPPSRISAASVLKPLKESTKADAVKVTGKAKAATDGDKPDKTIKLKTSHQFKDVDQSEDADEAGTIVPDKTTDTVDKSNDDMVPNNQTADEASHGTVLSANIADETNPLDDGRNQRNVV